MEETFSLFGPGHVAVLAGTALSAVGGAAAARRGPRVERAVRGTLAAAIAGSIAAYVVVLSRAGTLHWSYLIPLQLCDFAILVAGAALVTRWRPACEVLYFWACTGTLLAMVMPAVTGPFRDPVTAFYFALHALVVIAAVVVTWGARVYPRASAPLRVIAFTAAYGGVVAVVNLATDSNFLFLRGRPPQPTLLDYFGPWPIYLVVVAGLALVLFWLLSAVTPRAEDDAGAPGALPSRR